MYVPARRVERAVVWGGVLLDTAALTLLLSHGAPICFAARDGRLLGVAWPPLSPAAGGAALLERRRADPEWVTAYRSLLDAEVRRARLGLVRSLDATVWSRWRDRGFRGKDWEAWRQRAFSSAGPELDAAWRYLKTLLLGAVSGWLLSEGFDPHRGVLDAKVRLGLVKEFVQPLTPWIDGAALWGQRSGVLARGTWIGQRGEIELTPAGVRRWTARFEAELAWLERDVRRRIDEVVVLARDWQPEPVRPVSNSGSRPIRRV